MRRWTSCCGSAKPVAGRFYPVLCLLVLMAAGVVGWPVQDPPSSVRTPGDSIQAPPGRRPHPPTATSPGFHCNATNLMASQIGDFGTQRPKRRVPKVLNFFAVPPSRECLSDDGRRSGVCFNPYECKIQNGEPRGQCARGFGVCCVFTATCGDEVVNNITYFVNPGFPGLHSGVFDCEVKIRKMASHVSQLRLDFIHFNLGQPNRRTGNCEADSFVMGLQARRKVKNPLKLPSQTLRICGQSSGHHVYYDVENYDEPVTIRMNLTKEHFGRLWEIRITQVRFNQRAPAGCLEYHHGVRGIIQTMNFGDNGRHLANQDYSICMRQEEGYCSIAYEPCDENSFRIGPPLTNPVGIGSFPPATNPIMGGPLMGGAGPPAAVGDGDPETSPVEADDEEPILEEDDDGSGIGGMLGNFQKRSFLSSSPSKQIPFTEILGECADRIVMPCDSEEFIAAEANGPGICDLLHCGSSFCNGMEGPCRIESSSTPFLIQVHFGPGLYEESPEDNLGMCLRYEQLPCL
ncbi:uncharacterized protein [Hetaerina americana]|uniref:uncharacterized protein n=1 Tax=Hetaerina americana TaxID=62018 RepID=UPI003A7F5D51